MKKYLDKAIPGHVIILMYNTHVKELITVKNYER